jgi:hypothetical protein
MLTRAVDGSGRVSLGNPKDCGASISSQGLILTPETSRKMPVLSGLGLGMDSLTAPLPLPASCRFGTWHRRKNPASFRRFSRLKKLAFLSLMALIFSVN